MQTGKQTSAPTPRIAAAVLQENRKKKKRKRMTEKTEKEKLNSRISVSISCL